eukprot:Skav205157  [mRNA]  locus=scaffold593:497351:499230:- [translate_table: standard]
MFLWILCFLAFGWATASDGQWFPELETDHATLQATTNTSAVFSDKFLRSRSLGAIASDPDTDSHMNGYLIAGMVMTSWGCLASLAVPALYYSDRLHETCSSKTGRFCLALCVGLFCPLILLIGLVSMSCYGCSEMGRRCYCCSMKRQTQASEQASRVPSDHSGLPTLLRASKPASAPAPAAAPKGLLSRQVSAQWPRGKVANFTIQGSTMPFEVFGHQYTLDPDANEFRWPDGTVQTFDHKDRNTFWWRTNHPNPEWQRFQWVCYQCCVCHSSQGPEEHWQCVEHDVHLCCYCAVPPLKTPTLGVCASFIVDIFPSLARSATGLESPNFHEIRPELATGEHGLGFRMLGLASGRVWLLGGFSTRYPTSRTFQDCPGHFQ